MDTDTPTTVYLKDYRPPDFLITHSDLDIRLGFDRTTVHAHHTVVRNNPGAENLALNCELMEIECVILNRQKLDSGSYLQNETSLTIFDVPDSFTLEVVNHINPSKNTALTGLYKSAELLCTQCEAEGYRRISPGIDRPDNLATYRVKLTADRAEFPVLLCNGNLVDSGSDGQTGHYTVWQDPFPKPTYLFAIVAGRLSCMADTFTTMSGRMVALKFYARDQDIHKCGHAMNALKNAMAWDEQQYGREYDLDLFNVVAVDDFNMGAMENKSLNIFNTRYVLADPDMATDSDFQNVEGVVGHEYFHNWSGNRITCRDWFQLSLKEGFTVFRDQEFSADMGSRGVKRIDDVNQLRASQFEEDSGPMAHAVRPDSYQEINNFYTATVYNKGAEVVRMMHTILGPAGFRAGTDLYFARHDGQAVTTDDFVAAMETAGRQSFRQFKHWYSQAGTPVVHVDTHYDRPSACYEIRVRQSCPDTPGTPGQKSQQPFVIPMTAALFSKTGEKLLLDHGVDECTLILDKPGQTFKLTGIHTEPIPSLFRKFSAPVIMNLELSDDDLETLLNYDDDPFNRWEAAQNLFLKDILNGITDIQQGRPTPASPRLVRAFNQALNAKTDDLEFLAALITLPDAAYISEKVRPIDPTAIERSRQRLKTALAASARPSLTANYQACQLINQGNPVAEEMAARSLRDVCLGYLNSLDEQFAHDLCIKQLKNAKCMTDAASAIRFIARSSCSAKQSLLDGFYEKWKDEPLVVDKWLQAQAVIPHESTLGVVENLTRHPSFDHTNPNKVYSLILGFTHGNPYCFHAADESGYAFLVKWIEKLDPVNPQVAARLVSALNSWGKFTADLQQKMKKSLLKISSLPNLSRNVSEIVDKTLWSTKP